MEEYLAELMHPASLSVLLTVIVVSIAVLAKSADWLVEEAVILSERSGIPKVVIGATVVSLGTTTPEAAVSVFAALNGRPELALGNAVGSVICDTGLIIGLSCLIAPLAIPRAIANRQGWLQMGAVLLLVAVCFPWTTPADALPDGRGGSLSQVAGLVFLALLIAYLFQAVRWSRNQLQNQSANEMTTRGGSVVILLIKLVGAVALVVISSNVLIPAVSELAHRLHVPQSIIAATLIAFGTSLPELVTAVTAAYRRHGDLAIGNVIGADILNVLFVAGASAAATPAGLTVTPHFFRLYFPAMVFIVCVFRLGTFTAGDKLGRNWGVVLLAAYLVILGLSWYSPSGNANQDKSPTGHATTVSRADVGNSLTGIRLASTTCVAPRIGREQFS